MADGSSVKYGDTKEAHEANRRHAFQIALLSAGMALLGTLAIVAVTLFGTLYTVAHQSKDSTVKVTGLEAFGNGLAGLTKAIIEHTLNPTPAREANSESPQQAKALSPDGNSSSQQSTPDVDVSRIPNATCRTSDSADWEVATDDVKQVQDATGNYYSADARLKNLSPNTVYITHTNLIGSLTDNSKNHTDLRSSVAKNAGGQSGNRVAPSSDALVTFISWPPVKTALGTKVDFNFTFQVTGVDSKSKLMQPYTLAVNCHNLPVA